MSKCTKQLKGAAFACRQCRPCRINARRIWTSRLMLEARLHETSAFITLTYDDKHLPLPGDKYYPVETYGSLVPKHLKLFDRRLRRACKPLSLRFFAVGEYGDLSFRPHYHAIYFGTPPIDKLRFIVREVWPYGRVDVQELVTEHAQYCAGYCSKKMTKQDDSRLGGRYPEFARMSLGTRDGIGGIGAPAVSNIASSLLTNEFTKELIDTESDVPTWLKTGGRALPLGRYLRSKLREKVGFDQKSLLTQVKRERVQSDRFYASMQALRDGQVDASQIKKKFGLFTSHEEADQKELNLSARFNMKKRRL